ncbi:hypothetical protein BUALT_Bualt01G0034300 [Buddleja alternifolia]|uniref:Glycosyltransferase n=1 Tax=Buddleja alternifolia TaxID=168488 RepID=A0AAV6YER0_9LAMI|nr:hypothetical protein BUALT_Bualt01G0034300 [Buddleja alternifolia]
MKPHVAFLPSSGMGHILPLFQLAKHLVLHHGFHVSFLVITTEASAAQNHFFQSAAAVSPDLSVISLPPADVSGIITGDMRVVTQISIIARESIKPLKPILIDLKPISLIIDIFTTDAIDVCRELSIPVYSFFTASTLLLTFSLYLPTLDREVEGDRLKYAARIFLNAWEDLDIDRIKALKENNFFQNIPTPPVYSIGPLIKDEENLTENDSEILAWLDAQPCESVIYVCLGSGGTLSSKQLTELALGLEMSRQRFILVARRPTDTSASAAYFNVGGDENEPSKYLPDGFVERVRGVGLVVPSWMPQLAVLSHPSTAVFLSHCGWNSTLESLVRGVPIIAWPLYAEQRMNASMLVEEAGVAVKVATDGGDGVIGREEIEKVVTAVMEGEQGEGIKRRAKELKESARKALENGCCLNDPFAKLLGRTRARPQSETTSFHSRRAFLAKAPVLPFILRYPYSRFSPAWDSISGVRHAILLLCQFVNYIEVTQLPVYYPSEQEKENPKLYAGNGDLILSNIGLAEKRVLPCRSQWFILSKIVGVRDLYIHREQLWWDSQNLHNYDINWPWKLRFEDDGWT